MKDTLKAHVLQPSGDYEKVDRLGKVLYCSQEAFVQEARLEAEQNKEEGNQRVFIPETHIEVE